MNASTRMPGTVATEEVARRLAEYRRLGRERRAPAHVVYHEESHDCPWAGCDCKIAGISFQLDQQGDEAALARWLDAWWTGSGLVARCPGCGRHVLFSLDGKRPVNDPGQWPAALLPDGWHTKAHVVKGKA